MKRIPLIVLLPILLAGCGTSIRTYPSLLQAREAKDKWIKKGGIETKTVEGTRPTYSYTNDPNPKYKAAMEKLEKKKAECEIAKPLFTYTYDKELKKRDPGKRGPQPKRENYNDNEPWASKELNDMLFDNVYKAWLSHPQRVKAFNEWKTTEWNKLVESAKKVCNKGVEGMERRLPSKNVRRRMTKYVPHTYQEKTKYRSCSTENSQWVCDDKRREGRYVIFRGPAS